MGPTKPTPSTQEPDMVPINPHFARTIANQRIEEHLDEAAAHGLASKGPRRHLGALLPVRVAGRKIGPVRLRTRIPGRAY
jgi:hypothetical protein